MITLKEFENTSTREVLFEKFRTLKVSVLNPESFHVVTEVDGHGNYISLISAWWYCQYADSERIFNVREFYNQKDLIDITNLDRHNFYDLYLILDGLHKDWVIMKQHCQIV
jgi:hypothetical protein